MIAIGLLGIAGVDGLRLVRLRRRGARLGRSSTRSARPAAAARRRSGSRSPASALNAALDGVIYGIALTDAEAAADSTASGRSARWPAADWRRRWRGRCRSSSSGAARGLLLARPLNALALGDDSARALGARPRPHPVAGAVRGHAAVRRGDRRRRADRLRRPDRPARRARDLPGPTSAGCCRYSARARRRCCCSAPTCVGRVIARPGELQVGIVTAVLGAPVFICARAPPQDRARSERGRPHRRRRVASSASARRVSLRVHPRRSACGLRRSSCCAARAVRRRDRHRRLPVSPGDVAAALFGGGDRGHRVHRRELRLPRALVALLVGAALGVSGRDLPGAHPQPARQPGHRRLHRRRVHRRADRRSPSLGRRRPQAARPARWPAASPPRCAVYLLAFKRGGTRATGWSWSASGSPR